MPAGVVEDFAQAILLDPSLAPELLPELARARYVGGDPQGAIEDYTRAIEIGPDAVIEDLKAAGLRGCGGAGFPGISTSESDAASAARASSSASRASSSAVSASRASRLSTIGDGVRNTARIHGVTPADLSEKKTSDSAVPSSRASQTTRKPRFSDVFIGCVLPTGRVLD